jgi:phosphoglycolate phosphatase-like HAD superfamily hydrolase
MFNNSPSNQLLLLWDIDGTLLRTKRKGLLSPHKNVLIKMGIKFNETITELPGATDYEVFDSLLKGVEPLPSSVINECFQNLDYESKELENDSTFDLCVGISKILYYINDNGWNNGILTGNTEKRMLAKLSNANILNFFSKNLMFSCKFGETRSDITKRARSILDSSGFKEIIIIGDTPRDIFSAKKFKFPIISVATGKFSVLELSHHKPDLLLRDFEKDIDMFFLYINTFIQVK